LKKNLRSVAMTKRTLQKVTGNYKEWLINSLRDKKEAVTYLQVALKEYKKDKDIKALLLALSHFLEVQ